MTLIQALKHQQLQNGFSLRLRKVSPGKKAECGALQRLKTSDGGELAPLGAGPGTFGRREVWEVCCWGQGSRLLGMCHIARRWPGDPRAGGQHQESIRSSSGTSPRPQVPHAPGYAAGFSETFSRNRCLGFAPRSALAWGISVCFI